MLTFTNSHSNPLCFYILLRLVSKVNVISPRRGFQFIEKQAFFIFSPPIVLFVLLFGITAIYNIYFNILITQIQA